MTKEIDDETERYLNALINNEVMYNGLQKIKVTLNKFENMTEEDRQDLLKDILLMVTTAPAAYKLLKHLYE